MESRIKKDIVEIPDILDFYKNRTKLKSYHIDNPVVLIGDKDINKIKVWTDYEIINYFKHLDLNKDCILIEIGCGTGRISCELGKCVKEIVCIDIVEDFLDIIKGRFKDVNIKNYTTLNVSFQNLFNLNLNKKFNRFVISGGVFMYINDNDLQVSLDKLLSILQHNCIIYISEPIALVERLTLKNFYAESLNSNYSAIYRTNDEYFELFKPLLNDGFKVKVNQLFFEKDIKDRIETRQWLYVLER